MQDFKVSVVIPAFNEEGNVGILAEKLVEILKNYSDYEIIFVDDGSKDKTLDTLKKLHLENPKIHYLSFSRNFGHQPALKAGLDFASGDCVISMDADLQHPPELIPQMIEKWLEGYDIVYTIREEDPKLSFFKRKTARIFYNLMNTISNIKIEQGAADFRLLDRSVVEQLKQMSEATLFYRGMVSWIGYRQYGITYQPHPRFWGKSKYSVKKMFFFALSGITSFSIKPLHIATVLGFTMCFIGFGYGIWAIIDHFFFHRTVSGWTSLILTIVGVGGVQLIMLGIIGEYLGKLFMESKKRPHYIIQEGSLFQNRRRVSK